VRYLNVPRYAKAPALLALGLIGTQAHAVTVPYPYVDVITLGNGIDVTQTGGALTVAATADAVVTALGVQTPILPQATFSLTGQYSAALSALESPTSNTYDYTNGTFSINNGTNLLTGTFTDLKLTSVSSALFDIAIGAGAVTYTGGTLAGTLAGGTTVGSFTVSTYATNANGVADLSQNFTGTSFTAKVGAVTAVPLPGPLPLLLSGIGAAGAFAGRRRRAIPA